MVIKNILLSLNVHIPKRGFSSEELLQALIEHLEFANKFLILALDEFYTGENQLLYNLTRLLDNKLNPVQRVSLIIITKSPKKETINTLQKNHIFFEKYSPPQLYNILKVRCDGAFNNNVVLDESLRLIAEIASEIGDVRYALNLLWCAGKHADLNHYTQITPEYMKLAKEHYFSKPDFELIEDLFQDQKLLLLAIIQQVKNGQKNFITMGETKDGYISLCQKLGIKPKRHTKIWRIIQELHYLGVICTEISGPGMRGKTTVIHLADLPLKSIEEKLMSQLKEGIEV